MSERNSVPSGKLTGSGVAWTGRTVLKACSILSDGINNVEITLKNGTDAKAEEGWGYKLKGTDLATGRLFDNLLFTKGVYYEIDKEDACMYLEKQI